MLLMFCSPNGAVDTTAGIEGGSYMPPDSELLLIWSSYVLSHIHIELLDIQPVFVGLNHRNMCLPIV
jgi:hypothetical protein